MLLPIVQHEQDFDLFTFSRQRSDTSKAVLRGHWSSRRGCDNAESPGCCSGQRARGRAQGNAADWTDEKYHFESAVRYFFSSFCLLFFSFVVVVCLFSFVVPTRLGDVGEAERLREGYRCGEMM